MARDRIISVDAEGRVASVEEPGEKQTREKLAWLAWLLDSSIPIPGTRLTIGIDAIIGLVPFLGDMVGVVLSSYILSEAARLGAPRTLLWRMAFNVGVEGLVGIIPLAGDVFDAAWKANQKNVRLLEGWLDRPEKARRSSRAFVVLLVLVVASFLALCGVAAYLVYYLIFR